jgi:hypothetical protein
LVAEYDGGDLIRDASELVENGVYHLRSTIRAEKEGRTACINIHEDEDASHLHHRIHCSFGTNEDSLNLLDMRGVLIGLGDRLIARG